MAKNSFVVEVKLLVLPFKGLKGFSSNILCVLVSPT